MTPQRLGASGCCFPHFLCLSFLICLMGTINLPGRVLGKPTAIPYVRCFTASITQKYHHCHHHHLIPPPGLVQPPAGLSLQRNLLTWHQKSLSSTFSSVISLPSHPSLSFFICKMGPISFVWKCIMGMKQDSSWKRAWDSRGRWKMLVSIDSFFVDPQ